MSTNECEGVWSRIFEEILDDTALDTFQHVAPKKKKKGEKKKKKENSQNTF